MLHRAQIRLRDNRRVHTTGIPHTSLQTQLARLPPDGAAAQAAPHLCVHGW